MVYLFPLHLSKLFVRPSALYIYLYINTQINLYISVLKDSFIHLSASNRMTLQEKHALRCVYGMGHIETGHYATRVLSSPAYLRTAL